MTIPELFKSRRFWSAVLGLVALIVTSLVPDLKEHIDVLVPAIVGIIGVLIGGFSIEDTASAWKAPEVERATKE